MWSAESGTMRLEALSRRIVELEEENKQLRQALEQTCWQDWPPEGDGEVLVRGLSREGPSIMLLDAVAARAITEGFDTPSDLTWAYLPAEDVRDLLPRGVR